jgi:hypothetical protein
MADGIVYIDNYVKDNQIYVGKFPVTIRGQIHCPATNQAYIDKLLADSRQHVLDEIEDVVVRYEEQFMISVDGSTQYVSVADSDVTILYLS